MKVDITNKDNAMVEITGEIPAEEFASYKEETLEHLGKDVDIKGFRKGHVPADVLEKHFGEMAILEEMAQRAIARSYPDIVRENNLAAIGRPEVSITKIAANEPLGFKITTAVMPDITLPDYKKIAAEALAKHETGPTEPTDKEVEDVIESVRRQYGHVQNQGDQALLDAEGKPLLPELSDDFVKKLGDFENVEDFKKKIRENIVKEKEAKEIQKKRQAILEALIAETKLDLPDIVVRGEQNRMLAQFQQEIQGMGLKFDEYLKHIGKTQDNLLAEWKGDAEKRAKAQLILSKIGEEEKVEPNKERSDQEVKHVLSHNPDLDPETIRFHVNAQLINEKVFDLLENQE